MQNQPMKSLLLSIIFFSFIGTTYAQKFSVTYYDTAWLLTTKKNGKFYRVGILDTVKYQYTGEVKDFYRNGVLEMKGRYKANIKVDTFYFYYPSGKLKTKGRYVNNVRYGVWTNYYENGKVKDKILFDNDFLAAIEYYEENGNIKMTNGTGDWQTRYYSDFASSELTIQGSFKDSLRHGKWSYYKKSMKDNDTREARLECIEVYENGKFMKAKYYSPNGEARNINFSPYYILPESNKFYTVESWQKVSYLSIESYPYLKFLPKLDSAESQHAELRYKADKQPQFIGGMEKFYAYLERKLKCSPDNRDRGRKIFVEFIVDSTGYIRKGSVVFKNEDIRQACKENIIETIENSPKWIPAHVTELKKDIPVKLAMPITL